MNFFCAIERREMEFEIDNGLIKINRGTLEELFKNDDVTRAVDDLNERVSI